MKSILDIAPEWRDFPGRKTLRKWAVDHMRKQDKTTVRRMVKEGTLDEHLDAIVSMVEQHAQMLIRVGALPSDAWRRAIRVHVYGGTDD